jgi:hypothetical protein
MENKMKTNKRFVYTDPYLPPYRPGRSTRADAGYFLGDDPKYSLMLTYLFMTLIAKEHHVSPPHFISQNMHVFDTLESTKGRGA